MPGTCGDGYSLLVRDPAEAVARCGPQPCEEVRGLTPRAQHPHTKRKAGSGVRTPEDHFERSGFRASGFGARDDHEVRRSAMRRADAGIVSTSLHRTFSRRTSREVRRRAVIAREPMDFDSNHPRPRVFSRGRSLSKDDRELPAVVPRRRVVLHPSDARPHERSHRHLEATDLGAFATRDVWRERATAPPSAGGR